MLRFASLRGRRVPLAKTGRGAQRDRRLGKILCQNGSLRNGAAQKKSSGAERMIKVQCRCGAVEVEITGEPIVQFFCHCDDCQAVHGGAYMPESVYPAAAVNVVRGDPTRWKLKRNPRVTCREC